MAKNDEHIKHLFTRILEKQEAPSKVMDSQTSKEWKKINGKLRLNNFLSFSWKQLNIYYIGIGIISAAGLILLPERISTTPQERISQKNQELIIEDMNIPAKTKIEDSRTIPEANNKGIEYKETIKQQKEEQNKSSIIQVSLTDSAKNKNQNLITTTETQRNIDFKTLADTSNHSMKTSIQIPNNDTIKEQIEANKEIIEIRQQDTIIKYDTVIAAENFYISDIFVYFWNYGPNANLFAIN